MKLLLGGGVAAAAVRCATGAAAAPNPLERRKAPAPIRAAAGSAAVKCVGVEGYEEHWAHCATPWCDQFTEYCRVVEEGETTTTTTTPPTTTIPPTTTTTKAPVADCDHYAKNHGIPADTLDDECAELLVSRTCTAVLPDCSDAACVEKHLATFYGLMGLEFAAVPAPTNEPTSEPAPTTAPSTAAPTTAASTTAAPTTTKGAVDPPPATGVDCDAMAAKGSIPSIEASCSDALIKSLCEKYTAECSDDATCVEGKLKTKVESLDGTWDGDSSQPAPTTTTTTTTTTTKNDGGGGDPDDVPFARNISPRDMIVSSPWGFGQYNGVSGYNAAVAMHEHITEAIRDGPSEFKKFCGTGDIEKDQRECAAFFANVAKETGGMSTFEESTGVSYCTHDPKSDNVNDELREAGADWPCCVEEDKVTPCTDRNNCYYGCRMHGRGAIQLTWNFNYGRFSEYYHTKPEEKDLLLRHPELVEPRGKLGWAASIWFWMTSQEYGGACPPDTFQDSLPEGHMSCHDAMHMEGGGGFGQTIRIINGGYEACKTTNPSATDGAHARVGYFFNICADWGIPAAPGCAVADPLCDVSGKEEFEKTDGVVGNPQIAYPQSPDCPGCRLPGCSLNIADKWSLCSGSPSQEVCEDPIKDMHQYKCTF